MRTESMLPPAPPTREPATAPKKRNDWITALKILGGIVVVGGLLILGAVAIGTAGRDDPTTTTDPTEAVSPAATGVDALDTEAIVQHAEASMRYLNQGADASANYDIEGASLFAPADEWHAIADLSEPVPEIATQSEQVAVHLDNASALLGQAADQVNAGNLSAATDLITQATAEMDSANTDIQTTTAIVRSYS